MLVIVVFGMRKPLWICLFALIFTCQSFDDMRKTRFNQSTAKNHFGANYSSLDNEPNSSSSKSTRLLVLLVDGLRWDLLSAFMSHRTTSGFNRLRNQGAFAERIRPVFPAECYPNLYSLFTGLLPREHGVLFTTMFDPRSNNSISYAWQSDHNFSKQPRDGEVIWETAAKQNKLIHLYHLPICDENSIFAGLFCYPYDPNQMNAPRLLTTINKVLNEFRNNMSDLTIVYYDELDRLGHKHGPVPNQYTNQSLSELATIIDYIVDQMTSIPDLHLIITSDHGMTEVIGDEFLDRFLKSHEIVKVINRGSTVSIWPHSIAEVYKKLLSQIAKTHFEVYNQTTIPVEWYTGGQNFPPILLVAKPGILFHSNQWPRDLGHYDDLPDSSHLTRQQFGSKSNLKGMHGYDPTSSDMHIPLFIYGPTIRPGYEFDTKPIVSIHTIYYLIAKLSGIQVTNKNNVDFTNLFVYNTPVVQFEYTLWTRLTNFSLLKQGATFSILMAILVGMSCFVLITGGLMLLLRNKYRALKRTDLKEKLITQSTDTLI